MQGGTLLNYRVYCWCTMAKQDPTLAIVTHILGIFFGFIPALVVYLVAPDKFTKDNVRPALNWQLSTIIYYIGGIILAFVLIGFLVLFAVNVLNIVFSIMAAIAASKGDTYKYPLAIPFVKQ